MASTSRQNAERALETSRIVRDAVATLSRLGAIQRPPKQVFADHEEMVRRAAIANLCIDKPHYEMCQALRDDD